MKAKTEPLKPVKPTLLDPLTLGLRLRTARKQLGWTLTQLSDRANVSVTTISRAERGQLALGYENLSALGQALQIGTLFSKGIEASPGKECLEITRAGEGVHYRGLAFSYEFLATGIKGKPINPVLGTVHARSLTGQADFARHAGVEFVYVLTGEIEVHFENLDTVHLKRGDSLYFDSRIGHAFVTVSKQLAKVIGVITVESNHMALAKQGQES
ncbi:MAG: XRE family transcriptional regulator [Comamonadaceae bacterium]|nr:MAG: XRE family transcriptional regulator [Comamonadaceae bacterium]